MRWGLVVAGLSVAASCGGTSTTLSPGKDASVDSASACTPGQSVPCAGPGGCLGGQACNAEGTGYLTCDCGMVMDASLDSSSGSSESQSGSSSGSSSGCDSGSVSYKDAVLADAPAGYWRLDESGGVAADVSGNNYNGTYQGGVTRLAPGALLTDCDSAVILNGTSGYITTGFVQTSVTAYSIEGWFKTTAPAAGSGNWTVLQDRGSGNGLSVTLLMAGTQNAPCNAGNLMFVFDTAGYESGVCSTSAYDDGQWHHAVGTFSASAGTGVQCGSGNGLPGTWTTWTSTNCPEFQLYVDGAPASAVVSGGAVPFSAPLTGLGSAIIGYDAPWNSYFPGSIDEVAVYLSALPAARVAAHYSAAGY